eukprot:CAMPEP_0196575724 /NCGR_PEP_ID=MMETSP1081-20130531/5145_1 /TAXON_ID=36882 /ORGANISM="Pyramimonas amylifera, Strain CCMP720" /LENGTH=394 /DNA_ID=CAMNT_0041894111 /DNA_START=462 /DNA_END=1646 /DNA_ORIENTATION=+
MTDSKTPDENLFERLTNAISDLLSGNEILVGISNESSLKSSGLKFQLQNDLARFLHSILDNPPYPDANFSDAIEFLNSNFQVGGEVGSKTAELVSVSPLPLACLAFLLLLAAFRRVKDQQERQEEDLEMEAKRKELDNASKARARAERAQEVRRRELAKLKSELMIAIQSMGEDALRPTSTETREAMTRMVERLEKLGSRTDQTAPLGGEEGDWELLYASRGTALTRPLLPALDFHPAGVRVSSVSQSVAQEDGTSNAADISLGPLGTWRVKAGGSRQEKSGTLAFTSLSISPVEMMGVPLNNLPEFTLPLPKQLQREETWVTSFVDNEVRVSRGEPEGAVYVFRRRSAPNAASKSLPPGNLAVKGGAERELTWTKEAQAELDRIMPEQINHQK